MRFFVILLTVSVLTSMTSQVFAAMNVVTESSGNKVVTNTVKDAAKNKVTTSVSAVSVNNFNDEDITSKFIDATFKAVVYDKIGKSSPSPILYKDVNI